MNFQTQVPSYAQGHIPAHSTSCTGTGSHKHTQLHPNSFRGRTAASCQEREGEQNFRGSRNKPPLIPSQTRFHSVKRHNKITFKSLRCEGELQGKTNKFSYSRAGGVRSKRLCSLHIQNLRLVYIIDKLTAHPQSVFFFPFSLF